MEKNSIDSYFIFKNLFSVGNRPKQGKYKSIMINLQEETIEKYL